MRMCKAEARHYCSADLRFICPSGAKVQPEPSHTTLVGIRMLTVVANGAVLAFGPQYQTVSPAIELPFSAD